MNCPECAKELTVEVHKGIHLDVCEACAGIWFDRGELERYCEASETDEASLPLDPSRFLSTAEGETLVCPGCGSSSLGLHRVDVFHGAACDRCGGVWLSPAPTPVPRRSMMRLDSKHGVYGLLLDLAAEVIQLLVRRR